MASGKYSSEDELLKDALEALQVEDQELRAIEEALDDLASGDEGIPLDEAFSSLRAKYDIPADA
jgi:Arc/MetJ-type ribon-helix-helix transcriptional regulator